MPKKNKLSEPDLITAIQNRQRIGAAALYDMYSANLYHVIYLIVRNEQIAEDVLQQSLMKIWDSFHQYVPEKGRLYSWLVTLARNTALTMVRSKAYYNQMQGSELGSMSSDVDRQHSTHFDIELLGVKELLNLLKADQRQILLLIYFEGYTHVEAAEYLAIPLGTVKTRWTVGIKTLRHLLQVKKVA